MRQYKPYDPTMDHAGIVKSRHSGRKDAAKRPPTGGALIVGRRAVTYVSVSVHSPSCLGDRNGEATRKTRTLEGWGNRLSCCYTPTSIPKVCVPCCPLGISHQGHAQSPRRLRAPLPGAGDPASPSAQGSGTAALSPSTPTPTVQSRSGTGLEQSAHHVLAPHVGSGARPAELNDPGEP